MTPGRTAPRHRWDVGLVVLAALGAYGATLWGTFVFDDVHSVVDNPAIRSVDLGRFLTDPSAFSPTAPMYRPVVVTTLALNFLVGGLAPWVFRLFDLALHASCAALVYGVALRLRAARWAARIGALWFAVHPLASEAVGMTSARSDQLMLFGLLLALRAHPVVRGRPAGVVLAAVGTAIACGGKETGVLVPACLLGLEVVLARRAGRWPRWRDASVRLAAPAAVAVAYLGARRFVFGVATAALPPLVGGGNVHSGGGRDLTTQLASMAMVLPRTLLQIVVPHDRCIDPPVPYAALNALPVCCGAFGLTVVTWLALRQTRRPGVVLGVVAAWIVAAPWIVLPLNQLFAEHRIYAPLAMLALVLAGALPRRLPRPVVRPGAYAAAVGLVVLGALSFAQTLRYRTAGPLWDQALRVNPQSVHARVSLAGIRWMHARAALREGAVDRGHALLRGALDLVREAEAIDPFDPRIRRARLRYLLTYRPPRGAPFAAVALGRSLLALEPRSPVLHIELSRALTLAGRHSGEDRWFTEAERIALHTLEVAEPKGLVYRVAAEARRAAGDLGGAVELLDRSIARGLDHETVRFDRAELLIEAGRLAEAGRDLAILQSRVPFDPRLSALGSRLRAAAPR